MKEPIVSIEVSQIRIPGEIRHLRVDRYIHRNSKSRAIVMATAFIENGYWFQIEKQAYSLAERIAQEGFDVHVLSFELDASILKRQADLPSDASFTEIVCKHLPDYHEDLSEHYQEIHYLGHSYGVTMLAAFLLGYERRPDGSFFTDADLARRNSRNVKSLISLAGLWKLTWPYPTSFFSREGLRSSVYPVLEKCAQLPIERFVGALPVFPTGLLSYSKYMPTNALAMGVLSGLEAVGLMPSFRFQNADAEALRLALSKGTGDESVETFLTVLNLHPRFDGIETRTRALSHFTEDLGEWKLPILFVQGACDQVTHPAVIRRYGYERIPIHKKSWVLLKNTGHQDMLTAKDADFLFAKLKRWLSTFPSSQLARDRA